MRLAGRRVLITGAASGIGRATAELFAQEGAALALVDRHAAGGEAGGHVTLTADVADESAVRRVVAEAVSALGGLDGVVNSAGVDLLSPLGDTGPADWAHVLAVNLTGPYLVCRAALPALRAAGGGTIVNVASGAALRPLPNRTAYCASKAGLVMFGKSLAIEAAADNVRVNAVCPGIVDTPMFRASVERAADPEAELERIKDRYVIRRVAEPIEIARAVLYLTSAESSFVTGAALAVDGGRTFH
jgi:NAD(P)-dependent dehydrogenase (short-subunit alcohol dehydrogenase family)